jgi:tRNA pseudouridine55 synthase
VRSIADDLGEALGCGAHLAALRRSGAGPFTVQEAWTLERLEALADADLGQALLPPDRLVAGLPAVELGDGLAGRFLHGQSVEAGGAGAPGPRRVYAAGGGRFLGIAECTPEGRLRPLRLLASSAQAAEKAR